MVYPLQNKQMLILTNSLSGECMVEKGAEKSTELMGADITNIN